MYRLSEDVVRKILRNTKSPQVGPFDINNPDPFMPKNTRSIGYVDPYAAIGLDFDYTIEFPYPFINAALPPIKGLDGYWLYRRKDLIPVDEPFSVPRYLADPNIQNADEQLDVSDCSVILPSEIDKLTCRSIMTFEKLIEYEPLILDCLNKDIK